MLGAGRPGARSAVPWSLVGPGWTLAEFSPGQPGSGGGPVTTFLVDPEGGRYTIAAWLARLRRPGRLVRQHARAALFAADRRDASSHLAQRAHWHDHPAEPARHGGRGRVHPPDGLTCWPSSRVRPADKLERYDLQGVYQATLATMARRASQPPWTGTCASGCGALSSPDGDAAVWGIAGDEMQLADSGRDRSGGCTCRQRQPPWCTLISWWIPSTGCWPAAPPRASRARPGSGWSRSTAARRRRRRCFRLGFRRPGLHRAWQAAARCTSRRPAPACPSAASGPGGLGVSLRLASSGLDSTDQASPAAPATTTPSSAAPAAGCWYWPRRAALAPASWSGSRCVRDRAAAAARRLRPGRSGGSSRRRCWLIQGGRTSGPLAVAADGQDPNTTDIPTIQAPACIERNSDRPPSSGRASPPRRS